MKPRIHLKKLSPRKWQITKGKRIVYVGPFKHAATVLDRLLSLRAGVHTAKQT